MALLGVARAYQVAAPPIIATFDYAYLVSAVLWGYVFFYEKSDLLTMAGLLVAMPASARRRASQRALNA